MIDSLCLAKIFGDGKRDDDKCLLKKMLSVQKQHSLYTGISIITNPAVYGHGGKVAQQTLERAVWMGAFCGA